MTALPAAPPTPTPPGVDIAISLEEVSRSYGSLKAVDGLSFTVKVGQIFALLGPNGAGKTTTVEMLEGYGKPDRGRIRVLGLDPVRDGRTLKQLTGLMLQQTALYQKIRVAEAIDLFCGYYTTPANPADLLNLVGLESHADHFFGDLSGGQKQRLSLALALAGKPRVAFLDEPTAAMDPQARLQTWEIIEKLRRDGVTILLTTHYMEEAQRLADHVAIIDHGKLIAFGTPEDLTASLSTDLITFTSPDGPALDDLKNLPHVVAAAKPRAGVYTLTTNDSLETVAALAAWRARTGATVERLTVSGATLEEVFLELTGQAVRE